MSDHAECDERDGRAGRADEADDGMWRGWSAWLRNVSSDLGSRIAQTLDRRPPRAVRSIIATLVELDAMIDELTECGEPGDLREPSGADAGPRDPSDAADRWRPPGRRTPLPDARAYLVATQIGARIEDERQRTQMSERPPVQPGERRFTGSSNWCENCGKHVGRHFGGARHRCDSREP